MPFDADPAVLTEASEALDAEYPGLRVEPFLGDFERDLGALPPGPAHQRGRRMIAFLGSTVSNLEPEPRAAFLAQVAAALRPGDTFLLGTDLVKDPQRLLRAYGAAAGVTALPSSRRHPRYVPRPIRRGVPHGCTPGSTPLPWPSP